LQYALQGEYFRILRWAEQVKRLSAAEVKQDQKMGDGIIAERRLEFELLLSVGA
jgi:hypothetical protein